ncbi:MAG TPA: DNA polymerase III subunit beta [Methylomusa anaerophila]|uniref:Beta sliding clamp n=1 Tax=Methylomusa anaerophila TaxID=1930071 RepID=A0A348AHM0_9FIRM|nr:DNA polymerase III subunit beta [Methylomusa anaerophila]BBB90568.1 DNA polymerase III subunit beta [Methylomusa anaerophila]HML88826.1 DNA polymerase III subunit beta [Methylomusa anaerophila]
MKLVCMKDLLNHAAQTVQKAISSKNTMPILSGIYLSANSDENKLELQATDYEMGISCTIDADVEIPGQIVLSGRYFQELVKRLPGEMVEISSSQEDHTIKIVAGLSQFNLLSLPAEEFPVLQPMTQASAASRSINWITVKDNVLKELIRKTTFACAAEESRPIFTGALLETTTQDIRMIATNTHRLAMKKYFCQENQEIAEASDQNQLSPACQIIIPSKVLNELARLLTSELPVDVNICWEKSKVSFSFENVYFEARLIEGQYPDYNRVIPHEFTTTSTINTSQFLDAVERVSLMAKDGEYNVIKFQFQPDEIVITSNNPDIGKAYESIPVSINGNELTIAFNAKYVIDILKNIGSTELEFSLNTPLSPASIKPVQDENYTYVITPVRTS